MNHFHEDLPLILIVDDEPFTRMLLRLYLEPEGYLIAEASNGFEAVRAYNELHPNIILLDAMMPEMDGFTCCAHFQSLENSKYTPVLIITALEDKESIDRAFEVGATDYVTKPIHLPVLRQRVKRLIQQSQLQQKLEIANIELQRLATIDGLTQVANRRQFEEYLAQEWLRLAREQLPLSLILCDLDFFKSYNDTYGHRAGDKCLSLVATALKETIKRPADLIARYGGEEFAVILPNTDTPGSAHVAEKLCSAIRQLSIPHRHSQVSSYVTLSAGVATEIPQPGSNVETLVTAADVALYQAKAKGRNCYQYIKRSQIANGISMISRY
jgi:diguanylate cyclase (GGDEF)-like protein